MLNFKQIGSHLQKLREKIGYSQEKIAKLLGVQRTMLSYYENGTRNIPLSHLEKLADLYCVEVNDLVENDPEVNELNIACAFKAKNIQNLELSSIAKVNKIIKNYLKMTRIEERNG